MSGRSRRAREKLPESYLFIRKHPRNKRKIICRSNGQPVTPTPEQLQLFRPEFIAELDRKAINEVLQASRYTDETGARFPYNIAADPGFNFVVLLNELKQSELWITQNVSADQQNLFRTPIVLEYLERVKELKIIAALQPGNRVLHRLRCLQKLYRCLVISLQTGPLPIRYFMARVAGEFLNRNILPYKKEVREEALERWAAFNQASLRQKTLKQKQTRWRREYLALGLNPLPSAPAS
jgi:hypothetical protein